MSSIVLYTDVSDITYSRKFAKKVGAEVKSLQKLDRKRPMDMSPYDTVYLLHGGMGYKKMLPMMVSFFENNRHQMDKVKFVIHVWYMDSGTQGSYQKGLNDIRRHIDYFTTFYSEDPDISIISEPADDEYAQLLKRDLGFETYHFDDVSEYSRIMLVPENNHMTQTTGMQAGRAYGYLLLVPMAFGLLLRSNLAILIVSMIMCFVALMLCLTGLELQRKIEPMTFYKRLQNLDGTPKEWPNAQRYGRICIWAAIILTVGAFILMGLDAFGAFGLTDLFGNLR